MAVQLQLLGLPRLLLDDRTVAVSWPRQTLALLTYLVTSRGAVPRDAAAFALWPDEDEDVARANLRRNLNLLRGVLPPEILTWIAADSGSLEFRHADADTDVATFEAAAEQPDTLPGAAKIYGGDFAATLDEPWVLIERERLRARFHAVLAELVSIEFSARRFDEALAYARRIFADEPFREDIARRIMSIRYAMGDRPGALTEFERFARSLRTEMNIDPMPETFGLRDLVLRGEPLPFAPDAAHATAEFGAATPAPLLPFTGRRMALDRLHSAWQSAGSGAGAVIFVGGEAGIGKTRIVAEFLERIVGTSARILRGTTASPEAQPYEALLRALSQAAPFVPTLNLEPVWLGALASLAPEIAARCSALPARAALPAEREVSRLFEAFTRFAIALARPRPVVIVLEDLHWSGAGTFDAVRHLAGRVRGHRILLVATYRTSESPAVETLVRDLHLSRHADVIALTRLLPQETLEVLARAEPPITGPAAAELAQRSEGHPLFLTEVLRDYPETSGVVTGGIVELIGARLELCSDEARTLARIAAVCGAAFDLDLLQRVAGWDDGTLIDGLAELLRRQFIRSTAIHERGTYTFSHALVRNAVIGSVEATDQRRLHRIVARVLEARESGARYDAEIAQHWALAGDTQRAAEAYLRSARGSFAAHARDEAADLATRGLESTAQPVTQQALLKVRIEANFSRMPAAVLRSDAAWLARIANEINEDARYDAALLAFRVEQIGGDLESRLAKANALRAFASKDAADPIRLARIADADKSNALLCGNFSAALEHAHEALRRYQAGGETRDELRSTIFISNVQTRLGRPAQALALLVDIEPRVMALNDPALAMDFWLFRANVSNVQRDSPAALKAAECLDALARAAGDRLMEGHAAVVSAAAHQHASALTRTLIELDRADATYRSIGATFALQTARNNRASLLLQIGRIDEAATLFRALYEETNTNDAGETRYFAASNLGCALLAAGEIEAALKLEQEALALARSMGSEGFAALALGDLGAVEIAAERRPEGLAHLLEAAALNRGLNRPAVLAHDLARAAGAEPTGELGAAHARGALAVVEADPGRVALAPEILSRCASAFERAGEDASAAYCRRRGRDILEARLRAIEGDDRKYYLALPWHTALITSGAGVPTQYAIS